MSVTTTSTSAEIEKLAIATIRGLAMDGPHAATSGHQGTAMALAPLAHVLYTRIMSYDPENPKWANRDRFILSPGHASILQYAMLHLCGFGLTIDDLKDFRQWDSKTPGHPEVDHTPGVEITTGPLGQGFASSVGFAMAEARLRALDTGIDHYTYVIASDGDLAEGISHEAASLAGHLGLGRLICVYDDNRISIDGTTDIWLSDNPAMRFEALGWHVIELGEAADDLDAMETALLDAKEVTDKPSMIILQSHIGTPSPEHIDTSAAHGYAFQDDDIAATKTLLGLDPAKSFQVDSEVSDWYREIAKRHQADATDWIRRYDPDAELLCTCAKSEDSAGSGCVEQLAASLPEFSVGDSIATRKASNVCLDALHKTWPSLVVGGADLTGNTGVKLAAGEAVSADNLAGNQVFYGVREHAMAAVMNGMALHGGVVPVGGTFLVFSDYCRPSIRLAALSNLKVIYSFTHDSVGVGEDGPTHQPIEHSASLRLIPNLSVIRPADATETAGAWQLAMSSDGPTALILTRQNVPVLDGTTAEGVSRGGYVVKENLDADITLIGCGSELQHCFVAAERLAQEGIAARVVSIPVPSLLLEQDEHYQQEVLGTKARVAIEAGVPDGWYRFADSVVGISRFGASAPGALVMDKLGINAAAVVTAAKKLL